MNEENNTNQAAEAPSLKCQPRNPDSAGTHPAH